MLRRRDAGMGIMGIVRFMREVWVRHVIPRGFAVPQCGLARAISYRWGDYCSSAPPTATLIILIILITLISAARRV